MARRAALPLVLLGLICSPPYSVLRSAQFPSFPERCSLPAHPRKEIVTWKKVSIKGIDFVGPIHLPDSDVARIIREANQKKLNADDPDWIKEVTEIGLRDAWQNRGYFKVYLTAEARSLSGNSTEERFLVTAHVEEGLQYHLRDIRFRGDSTIPETEMRAAIPIRNGDIFNVGLVRKGIGALTKLYNSHGYADFTTVPDIEIDDDLRPWISLVFVFDPEQQFRVGKVEIVGLAPKLEARLRGIARLGDIYNPEVIEDFLKKNRQVLPSGLSLTDDMHVLRNVTAGIVDLALDFRTCP